MSPCSSRRSPRRRPSTNQRGGGARCAPPPPSGSLNEACARAPRHLTGNRGNQDDFAHQPARGAGPPAGGGPPLRGPLGPDRGARRAAGLLRHPRPGVRLSGRRRGRSCGHPSRSGQPGQRRRPGPVQRRDLGADRDRVHARLRDHRADQLRARRRVHDRLLHLRGPVGGVRARAHHQCPGTDLGPAGDADHRDDRDGVAERPDRAGRLPPAAERAQARRADHGRRLLVHPPERGPALARRLAAERARPHPRAADGVHHRRRARSSAATSSRSR